NRSLSELEVRLPRGRRVQPHALEVSWESVHLEPHPSSESQRIAELKLPASWAVGERHKLRIPYEIGSATGAEPGLRFTNDAFFLPAADWSPEILPIDGLFGFGGSPPKKWELTARLPEQFVVHMSGATSKASRSRGEQLVRAVQTPADHYPFIVAGRYATTEARDSAQRIVLWSRSHSHPGGEGAEAGPQLAHAASAYDAAFGRRSKHDLPLWIVECPDPRGCFTNSGSVSALLSEGLQNASRAEMISSDTAVVDLSAGVPTLATSAAPSLAASWLGYGQNPGFYEQVPPLSMFPAFAAALGREAVEGPAYRTQVIRRVLARIPGHPEAETTRGRRPEEPPAVVRAKSFLF